MAAEPLLRIQNIVKQFPGVRALDGVSLDIKQGEIHCLVGENGAGKSTLIKILAGVHSAGSYSGDIFLAGERVRFHSVLDSERAGIAVIHQELALVRHMTVAENLFLGHEPGRWGLVNRNRMRREANVLLSQLGLNIDADTEVVRLGVGQQQLVEIAKALRKKSNILILDEPTAALADREAVILFGILERLRAQGSSILYISHKLDEVFRLGDRITVLRDGSSVMTDKTENLTRDKVVHAMVGREISEMFPREMQPFGKVRLEVEHLTVRRPDTHRLLLKDISFCVHEGEILGISGLMGAGRTELLSTLFGSPPGLRTGEIRVDGQAVRIGSPADAIQQGFALVPEDRKQQGLVLCASVEDNIALAHLSAFVTAGVVDGQRKKSACEVVARKLDMRASSLQVLVETLSGGNQQKAVLGRWLLKSPKMLFLDEPTRGVDVGAKAEIHRLISDLAKQGMAVVVASSDLPEVLGISHRILVLRGGSLAGEFAAIDATAEKIMHLAT